MGSFFVHSIVLTATVERNYEPSAVSEVNVARPHLHDITTNAFVFGDFEISNGKKLKFFRKIKKSDALNFF